MSKADYYETLGISRGVDEKELKSAFRKKAMQFHPDRNPGDKGAEQRFKDINEAYEILKDPQKRAAYDQFGHAAFENGGMGNGGFGGAGMGAGGFSDIFEDIFGEMMGGRGRRSGGRDRGADLRYNMEVSLEDAYHGKTAEISVPTAITCETCSGSGAKPGSQPKQCATCAGSGRVRAASGFFSIERTCPACQGRGEVISDPCSDCHGQGRVTRERNLTVNIPAGIEDGVRIRLAGEGEAGARGGPAGDLYIFLTIKPHEFFQREGSDLFCRIPVSMTTAALGGRFEVTTLDGSRTRVNVPEGTQTGKVFRLRGKGIKGVRASYPGDLYCHVVVETPIRLSDEQKALLRQFETSLNDGGDRHSPKNKSWTDRVKDFFS